MVTGLVDSEPLIDGSNKTNSFDDLSKLLRAMFYGLSRPELQLLDPVESFELKVRKSTPTDHAGSPNDQAALNVITHA